MAELTTHVGNDIAVELRRLFGDEDSVQITDTDILKWINAGARKLTSINPILQMSAVADTTNGVATMGYPPSRIQAIQSIAFKGIPLTGFNYEEAQEYIAANGSSTASGDPVIWWQWAQTIHFWPIPKATEVGTITMDYLAIPVEITALGNTLTLPDRYFEALLEYCLLKAYILDENWDAVGAIKAMNGESIAQLSEQENGIRKSTYPHVTVRPEDY